MNIIISGSCDAHVDKCSAKIIYIWEGVRE